MTKRTILTTIIIPILLISGLIIFIINNRPENPGELIFAEDRLDFGSVPEWKGQMTQTVLARNIGKSPINITRIQTGCSYAEIEGPMVIPHNSDVTYKVLLYPQFLPEHKSTATAIIFTDSPKTPQVYLTIIASVQRFATLSAEVCDFGEILPDKIYEKQIKLCVNDPSLHDNIRILPTEHKLFSWKFTPIQNTNCYTVSIELRLQKRDKINVFQTNPIHAPELFSSSLAIAFPNDRTLTLPIVAKIVEPVVAEPESLSYGIVKKDASSSLRFTLLSNNPFQVLELRAPDFLNVLEVTNPNRPNQDTLSIERYFEATLDPTKSPTLLRDFILIKTSSSSIPIRIPVYGYIHSIQPTEHSTHQNDE